MSYVPMSTSMLHHSTGETVVGAWTNRVIALAFACTVSDRVALLRLIIGLSISLR